MTITEYIPVNWGIIRAPVNWFIVLLMVIIAGFVIDILVMGSQMPDETSIAQ